MRSVARKHPKSICIETVGACNGSCIFCPYRRLGSHTAKLRDDTVYKLIDEISQLDIERLSLFNNNEPLLDERLPDFVSYARKKLEHRALTLSTNGKLITDELLEHYIGLGVDRFYISIPSLDQREYFELMGHELESVLAAIYGVSKQKMQNIRIAVPKTKFFNRDSFNAAFSERGIEYVTWELECIASWTEYPTIASICMGYSPLGCDRPLDQLIITATGNVALCCRDWQAEGIMLGSVYTSSIEEIWTGDEMVKYQLAISQRDYTNLPLCANCSRITGLHNF